MRKVALITHDFSGFTGSEIVVLEVANYFAQSGDMVTIRAERFSNKLKSYMHDNIIISDHRINIADFDIVWSQHGHFTLNTGDLLELKNWNGLFISAHLSSFVPAEGYHYPFASKYAHAVVFNSESVQDHYIKQINPTGYCFNLKNAAPRIYHAHPSTEISELKSILLVSNHPPSEVMEALELLKSDGLAVRHIGSHGEHKLIEAGDIQNTDAIISIGKTAQYTLAGGRPLYCYDHFGGPGWLNRDNFEDAEYHNFSGRCTGTIKSASDIRKEILTGFSEAKKFVINKWDYFANNYDLESSMDILLGGASESKKHMKFNDNECLSEIDSMRGALVHLNWIWEDVFARNVKVESEKVTSDLNKEISSLNDIILKINNDLIRCRSENHDKDVELSKITSDLMASQEYLASSMELMSKSWLLGILRQPWKASYWNKVRRQQRSLGKYY